MALNVELSGETYTAVFPLSKPDFADAGRFTVSFHPSSPASSVFKQQALCGANHCSDLLTKLVDHLNNHEERDFVYMGVHIPVTVMKHSRYTYAAPTVLADEARRLAASLHQDPDRDAKLTQWVQHAFVFSVKPVHKQEWTRIHDADHSGMLYECFVFDLFAAHCSQPQ